MADQAGYWRIHLLFHPKESGQSYYLEMHKISKSVGFNKDVPQFTFQTFLLTRLLWIVCEANLATYCGQMKAWLNWRSNSLCKCLFLPMRWHRKRQKRTTRPTSTLCGKSHDSAMKIPLKLNSQTLRLRFLNCIISNLISTRFQKHVNVILTRL